MYDVITIGTATRDAFLESPGFRILRRKEFPTGKGICFPLGAKLEVPRLTFTTGGGATNAAVTFARQGFAASCVAKVGGDVSGEEVKRGLRREGVDGRLISTNTSFPTAYSILLLTPGGERTVLVYRGASDHLAKADIPWSRLKARWFYIFPGNAVRLVEPLLRFARRRGIRVALNPSGALLDRGPRYFWRIIPFIDVLILNREEGARLTGVFYRREDRIFKTLDAWTPCLAVLTDGAHGVMVSDGVRLYRAGVFRERRLLDRTGAGDAFGSGFVAGLMRKAPSSKFQVSRRPEGKAVCDLYPSAVVEYAIRLGSANAASVVEHVGAKAGILTLRDFARNPRWQTLRISREQL